MIPFARIMKYGNVLPGINDRYKIYGSAQASYLLDTQTNNLYSTSYDSASSGTGKAEPKFVLTATNVKRLLLSDNSCSMQIYEDINGRTFMCGVRTAFSGVSPDNVPLWVDCTSWFTNAGLSVSDIAYMSGWYNLKLNLVMKNGDLWCCGKNNTSTQSSFGNNTNVDSFNAFRKITGISTIVKATGNVYLRADNTLWVCGMNSNYQLGNGTNTASASLQLLASNVTDCNVGYQNTYYITSDRILHGCGTQFGSQYGNEFGTGGSSSSAVVRYTRPVVMFANVDKLYVCVGNMATHPARYNSKTVYSTGGNALAQLGTGDRIPLYSYQASFNNFEEGSDLVRNNVGTLIMNKDGELYYSGRNDTVMGGTSTEYTLVFTKVDMSFIQ